MMEASKHGMTYKFSTNVSVTSGVFKIWISTDPTWGSFMTRKSKLLHINSKLFPVFHHVDA